jgi:hypothetical protein
MFCGHTLLVIALWRASVRNIEMGVLWQHMHLTDLPISLLADGFYDAYTKFFPQSNYPAPEVLFHLVFGGLQFFIWGWVVGIVANRLLKRRRPAQTV